MTRSSDCYVIDTSVAMKWYIPEIGFDEARLYMGHGIDRHAPDLLLLEATSVLLSRVRSNEPDRNLSVGDARMILAALSVSAPIQYHPDTPLLDLAMTLGYEIGAAAYDALFLALAIQLDGRLITADAKLLAKIVASPHVDSARWFLEPP